MDAGAWTTVGIVIAISVVAFVVLAILLGAFKSTALVCEAGFTYNASSDLCYNASINTRSLNLAGNITNNGLSFLGNTSSQLGTAGTILGVSLLLVIIAGIGFAGYRQYQKMR